MPDATADPRSIASRPPLRAPKSNVEMLLLAAVLLIAAAFRLYALGRLPGVNGDEAWYGVQVQRWLAGETVDWRTPTGNFPGPLQFGLLAALQSLFPPSFALLRIPALISSLGAMALAYAIGRRFFGPAAGNAALVLMAILPINIAYARFGWDPSHSGLVVLAALYAALDRRPYLSALAFAFAILVHPTNVFAAPLLALSYLGVEWEGRGRRAWGDAILYGAMLLLAALTLAAIIAGGTAATNLRGIGERLTSGGEWLLFPTLFIRLLTGDTVLTYVAGEGWETARRFADLLVVVSLAGLLAAGVAKGWGRFGRGAGLVAGWLATLLMFFILAGSDALRPHVERYGFVLVAPTAIVVAVLIAKCLPKRGLLRPGLLIPAAAVPLLGAFWAGYFQPLAAGSPEQHRAFWTGREEPKQAAYERIVAEAPSPGTLIVAEDWWLKWPIAYLARQHSLTVVRASEAAPPSSAAGPRYWVAYLGSPLDRDLAASGKATPLATIQTDFPGHALRVWRSADLPPRP